MINRSLKELKKFRLGARQEGTVSVEFVILFPLLALIVVGIMEFGYLWFVRNTLTNASREGARAAVVFYTGNNRAAWVQSTAQATVDAYLNNINFPAKPWTVTTAATGDQSGNPITVTVSSPNGTIMLHKFLPAFLGKNVIGTTTMKLE